MVGSSGGCLLIDPAVTVADLAGLAAELAARGLRPAVGWSTHPHWDHVLWSRELGDAPRYAAPAAVTIAETERDGILDGARQSAPGHDLELVGRMRSLDASAIPWDGPEARLIVHDGHAPGHGAVFLPDSGVLDRRGHVLRRGDTAARHRRGGSARRLPHRDGAAGVRARRPPGGARPRPCRGRRGTPQAARPGRRLPGRRVRGPAARRPAADGGQPGVDAGHARGAGAVLQEVSVGKVRGPRHAPGPFGKICLSRTGRAATVRHGQQQHRRVRRVQADVVLRRHEVGGGRVDLPVPRVAGEARDALPRRPGA